MVLTTAAGARGIAAAIRDALCAPFGADVVWEGLGVFGHVGADAVVAYA